MDMNQAEATVPRPISDALPKDAEVVKTKELVKTLIPFGMFPDDEELQKRERVLKRLETLYKDWLQEMYVRLGVTKYFAKRCRGRIIPYGSYCLGAHVKEAELDVLCVGPTVLKRKHFFTLFFEKLKSLREVKDALAIEKKYIPIIKLWFDGIQVNLVIALLPSNKLNDDKELLDKNILVDLNPECMQSLNGHRVTEEILKSVTSPSNFRLALRSIKLWAKWRNVHSNRRGFLGETSWAIMVAKVCQFYPNATASILVAKFFLVFSAWKWPNPVCLRYPEESISGLPVWDPQNNESDASHLMPVIKPAYPQENSSVTVSRSSLSVMMEEIKRGRVVTQEIMDGKAEWAKLFDAPDILGKYEDFILVEAVAAKDKQHLEWFNIVESKLPFLVTSLEKRSDISKSHVNAPWCGESENGKNMISKWLIGLEFKEEVESCRKDFSYNIQSFIKSAKSLALYSCYFRKGMDVKAVVRKRDDLQLPQNTSKSSASTPDEPLCSGDAQQRQEGTEVEVNNPTTEEESDSAMSSPPASSVPQSSKRSASPPTEALTESPKRCCTSAAGSMSSASVSRSPVEMTSGHSSSDDEFMSSSYVSQSKVWASAEDGDCTRDVEATTHFSNTPFEVVSPSRLPMVEGATSGVSLSESLFGTISSSSSDHEGNTSCFFPDLSPDETSDSKCSSSEDGDALGSSEEETEKSGAAEDATPGLCEPPAETSSCNGIESNMPNPTQKTSDKFDSTSLSSSSCDKTTDIAEEPHTEVDRWFQAETTYERGAETETDRPFRDEWGGATAPAEDTTSVEFSQSETGNFNWNLLGTFHGIPRKLQQSPSPGGSYVEVEEGTSAVLSQTESSVTTETSTASFSLSQCIYEPISNSCSEDEEASFFSGLPPDERSCSKAFGNAKYLSLSLKETTIENSSLAGNTSVWLCQHQSATSSVGPDTSPCSNFLPQVNINTNHAEAEPGILLNQSSLGALNSFTDETESTFLSSPSCDKPTDSKCPRNDEADSSSSLNPPHMVAEVQVEGVPPSDLLSQSPAWTKEETGSNSNLSSLENSMAGSQSFLLAQCLSRENDDAANDFSPPDETEDGQCTCLGQNNGEHNMNFEEAAHSDQHDESLSSRESNDDKDAPSTTEKTSTNCTHAEEAVDLHPSADTELTKRPARPLRRPLGPPTRASPRLKKPNLKFQPSSS